MSNTDVSTGLFHVSAACLLGITSVIFKSSERTLTSGESSNFPAFISFKDFACPKNPVQSGHLPKRALIICSAVVEGISDINSHEIGAATFEGIMSAPSFEGISKMNSHDIFFDDTTSEGISQMNSHEIYLGAATFEGIIGAPSFEGISKMNAHEIY